MDARCTPGWILGHHPEDQVSDFFGDSLPSEHASCSGEGAPIQRKSRPVPSHDGFGVHDDEGLFPVRPESLHENPEEFIERGQPWPRMSALQDNELLPKS